MTRYQFLNMIERAESRGHAASVGDGGHAIGAYQQHGEWMLDYWPDWCWTVLAALQRIALNRFVGNLRDGTPRPKTHAAELAAEYNLGHRAPDPGYRDRCMVALRELGLDPTLIDSEVE